MKPPHVLSRSTGPALLYASLALALLVPACDGGRQPAATGESSQARDWPPGTVLAVDDVPITLDEIDEASVWVERIEPNSTSDHLRRLTLTNIVLPRVLARIIAPQEREQALAAAQARLAELESGLVGPPKADGTLGTLVEGTFQGLSIQSWGRAMDLPAREWSGIIEEPGAFVILRRLEREDSPRVGATRVAIDHFLFPYLDPDTGSADLEAAYDEHVLTLVDPEWRVIVPELYQYRMGVHKP